MSIQHGKKLIQTFQKALNFTLHYYIKTNYFTDTTIRLSFILLPKVFKLMTENKACEKAISGK